MHYFEFDLGIIPKYPEKPWKTEQDMEIEELFVCVVAR
jgi:hypothetical protein